MSSPILAVFCLDFIFNINYTIFVAINAGIIALGVIFVGLQNIPTQIEFGAYSDLVRAKLDGKYLEKHTGGQTIGLARISQIFIYCITSALLAFIFIILGQYAPCILKLSVLINLIIVFLTLLGIFLSISALHLYMKGFISPFIEQRESLGLKDLNKTLKISRDIQAHNP